MAKNETARVRPDFLKADQAAYTALQAMPDYAPANTAFSKTTVTESFESYQAAEQAEINAIATGWESGVTLSCNM